MTWRCGKKNGCPPQMNLHRNDLARVQSGKCPGFLANVAAGRIANKKSIRVRPVPPLIPCVGLAKGCFRLPDFDISLCTNGRLTPHKKCTYTKKEKITKL